MAAPTNPRLCWICGTTADSAEHSVKRSDIFRLFGRGPYPKGKRLLKKREDGQRAIVQGPGSRHLTFENVICQACNNALTQPFDCSYDRFMDYVVAHASSVLRDRCIDLRRVFGICGRKQRQHLFKYFIKSFGCRIADAGLPVPPDLSAALLGGSLPTTLSLSFCVYEPLVAISSFLEKIAQVHRLEGTLDKLTGTHVDFTCGYSYGWLTVAFWYQRPHNRALGNAWDGHSRYLVLGSLNDAAV